MGSTEGGDLEAAGRQPQHGGEARRHGRHVAGRPGSGGAAASGGRRPRGLDRLGARGGPGRAAQAAPHREAHLRQDGGGTRLRGVLRFRLEARGAMEGRARARLPPRRLPRARLGARHGAGGLRELPLRGSRRPAGHEAARGDAAALQRPLLRRDVLGAARVPVRRAARRVRADRPGAGAHRPGQRHRGGQDGARRGDRVRAVLAVPGPLPLREPPLQPLFRQREGLRGERRRAPAPQPARPGAVRRLAGGAQRDAAPGLRAGQRVVEMPGRQGRGRGARRGPGGHDGAAGRPVRRGQVGGGRALPARPGASRGTARRERRAARRPRRPRRPLRLRPARRGGGPRCPLAIRRPRRWWRRASAAP